MRDLIVFLAGAAAGAIAVAALIEAAEEQRYTGMGRSGP